MTCETLAAADVASTERHEANAAYQE